MQGERRCSVGGSGFCDTGGSGECAVRGLCSAGSSALCGICGFALARWSGLCGVDSFALQAVRLCVGVLGVTAALRKTKSARHIFIERLTYFLTFYSISHFRVTFNDKMKCNIHNLGGGWLYGRICGIVMQAGADRGLCAYHSYPIYGKR